MNSSIVVQKKEEALTTAREWQDNLNTAWTDESRLENGAVGAALAFKKTGGWTTKGTYLGRNKEVFDAEVFAIMQAVRLLDERGETGKTYHIFSDSQAAIARMHTMVQDQASP